VRLISKLKINYLEFLNSERRNIPLLAPVLLGLGIGLYFSAYKEPDYYRTIMVLFIGIFISVAAYFFRKSIFIFCLGFTLIASGFFIAQTKALMVNAPKIQPELGVIWLRGKLERREIAQGVNRLLVSELDLWQPKKGKFKPDETPEKIRLNIRTKIADNVEEGDIIKARIILSPPPKLPAFPNGYDFARAAYFERIGGVGFSISPVEVFKKEQGSFKEFVNMLRRKIADRILNAVENKHSAATLAELLVNQKSGMDRKYEEMVRGTGLGHLIAISGMHMTIVMIWLYFSLRFILCLFPAFALNYDAKKLAAAISIIIGLAYTILINAPVSALRAYIMVSIFFIAIFINREQTPKRPIAFAAMFILALLPETLISPGFQMSFAAIIVLIAIYEFIEKIFPMESRKDYGFIKKFLFLLFEISLTTLLIGLATAPYAIYHFNTYPKYSIPANLIAIPATTFITMPFGFFSILLMPFGLEKLFLNIAALGVVIMNGVAKFFYSMPNPVIRFPAQPDYLLYFISMGFVWYFIFKTRIRYLGVPLIITGYLMILLAKQPFALLSENRETLIYRNNSGRYEFTGKAPRGFAGTEYSSNLAYDNKLIKNKYVCNLRDITNCPSIPADIIGIKKYMNKKDHGTAVIYKGGRVKTSRSSAGYRIWN